MPTKPLNCHDSPLLEGFVTPISMRFLLLEGFVTPISMRFLLLEGFSTPPNAKKRIHQAQFIAKSTPNALFGICRLLHSVGASSSSRPSVGGLCKPDLITNAFNRNPLRLLHSVGGECLNGIHTVDYELQLATLRVNIQNIKLKRLYTKE